VVVGFRKTLYFIDRSVVLLVRQPRRVALEDCGLLVETPCQGLPGVPEWRMPVGGRFQKTRTLRARDGSANNC